MLAIRLTLLFAAVNVIAPVAGPLRVIRVTPESPADPLAEVTVTFDRPVAGGLDATVDPAAVFRIRPDIDGRLEWRDPLTIRFTPAEPLIPGGTYTVTVLPGFSAMDGAAFDETFTRSFTVSPPQVLATSPRVDAAALGNMPVTPTFSVLLSAPVDVAAFAARARIRLQAPCGRGEIMLSAAAERRVAADDPGEFRWTGVRRQPADSLEDLRRVVELRPVRELPRDCSATLRLPQTLEPGARTWILQFHTYGPLRADSVACAHDRYCPAGPVRIRFSTPIAGDEVVRAVRFRGNVPFTVRDTSLVTNEWILDARLQPRTAYTIEIDSDLTDIFGQTLDGPAVRSFRTTGYEPSIRYEYGRMLVEKEGLRTLPVQHVNVDTLIVQTIIVPDSMEWRFLGGEWGWEDPWVALAHTATVRKVPVRNGRDERLVSGIRLPVSDPRPGNSLLAVQVSAVGLDSAASRFGRPIALVQVTNLAVTARVATDRGTVWVTNVDDGLPREGVDVEIRDSGGALRGTGRTNADGMATITDLERATESQACCWGFEGYVVASTQDDRALVGISQYDPDLAPWRFGVWGAWEMDREPAAAAAFTERGIYRPGETVNVKAIVRDGPLGALRAPAGDSVRWTFRDREYNTIRDTVVTLSEFGTTDASITLPAGAPLGWYRIAIETKLGGEWKPLDEASYQVAEYRPPEFLVDAVGPQDALLAGDTARFTVGGRYLFGAPMAHSPVDWSLRLQPLSYGTSVPGAEGFTVGGSIPWWEGRQDNETRIVSRGVDTLDATGSIDLRAALPTIADGRPANATLVATVTDANRQTVSAAASVRVHPASVYIGARTAGDTWFWRAGEPVTIEVIAIRPDGERVSGIDVDGTIVRREWHRVRRVRNGMVEQVGGWVSDTVATCTVRSREAPAPCSFTPPAGGSYSVSLTATDEQGRAANTRFYRWASGPDWVPWNDETQIKMDVITDRPTYDVGDTATVFFASPFTDAEAWITVEREHVIESRRIRIGAGATTMKLPITEAHAPNVYVSIVVVRGRSAEPGPLDDPGRPTLRVGYAQLRVLPSVKRLAVEVTPAKDATDDDVRSSAGAGPSAGSVVYEPGDTATVRVRVTDAAGTGRRAEVTLWAVDEGVLALTGYRTPDPISLIYRERGLGSRLASNLAGVAAQIPEGQKGQREAGGGGGDALEGILRSRFRTTAFFLGSVVTDADGNAVARAGLPDNLTTFRVMAVAVTNGDRYGSGESSFLVTRPLVARPALPRFVRPGDRFNAGVVVNSRNGEARDVQVEASVTGIDIDGGSRRRERLAPGRGADVRFTFEAEPGDSATFQFDARSGDDRDAVRLSVPVRPDYHPLAATIAGAVRDTTSVVFGLRDDIDAGRSTLTIGFGSSIHTIIQGARRDMRIYPYYCTEQLSSAALPIIALYRARLQLGLDVEAGELTDDANNAIRLLSRRQNPSGSIGYWSAGDWSSPWLSAYAGRVLLEARDAGLAVDSTVLGALADYLRRSLTDDSYMRTPVAWYYTAADRQLTEKVAAAGFLSRYGQPDAATENTLLQQASRLRWEDRLALAEMLERRGEHAAAVTLVDRAWQLVHADGRRAVLPDTAYEAHYFRSSIRPAARLMVATLAVQPENPGIGMLAETLIERGRSPRGWMWNTQDYGWAVLALAEYERSRADATPARLIVRGRRGTLLEATVQPGGRVTLTDSTVSLGRLVERAPDGSNVLRLTLEARHPDGTTAPAGSPYWFFLTVHETPSVRAVDPVDRGIVVERWYENIETRAPITEAAEGQLVRVRLRVTVPEDRHFLVLDDALPAGLEPVDLSLRTVAPPGATFPEFQPEYQSRVDFPWYYGWWDAGMWSPFDHRELRDDRVVHSASILWRGTYTASYIARATTAGTFIVPPAHAEEMYNPGVNGRTGGSTFTVTRAVR